MRIALFIYHPLSLSGGVGTFAIELTKLMQKYFPHDEIEIITLEQSSLKVVQYIYTLFFASRSQIEPVDPKKEKYYQRSLAHSTYKRVSFLSLAKTLRQYDVVYSQNDILILFVLFCISFVKKLPPLIIGFHSAMVYPYTNSLQSRLHNILYTSQAYYLFLKPAVKFHVLNTFDWKILRKHFPRKTIVKITNPFSLDGQTKKIRKQLLKRKNKNLYSILWVGRLTEQKGVRDLVKIITEMQRGNYPKKIIWTIVGNGQMQSEVLNLSKMHRNINYFSQIDRESLFELYKKADLFVSTSLWESYPYAILEAQSFGVPVICRDIPGCNEIVKDKITGFLIQTREEMFQKITASIANSNLLSKKSILALTYQVPGQELLARKYDMLFSV